VLFVWIAILLFKQKVWLSLPVWPVYVDSCAGEGKVNKSRLWTKPTFLLKTPLLIPIFPLLLIPPRFRKFFLKEKLIFIRIILQWLNGFIQKFIFKITFGKFMRNLGSLPSWRDWASVYQRLKALFLLYFRQCQTFAFIFYCFLLLIQHKYIVSYKIKDILTVVTKKKSVYQNWEISCLNLRKSTNFYSWKNLPNIISSYVIGYPSS